ncbi:MAG: hypothetical protein PWP54_511 [Thermosipho sp. (in: thermotogales)]|nr:hypothetical protein [Thermosipho sp. (in: thermotogales)]
MFRVCKHVKEFEKIILLLKDKEYVVEECVDKCEFCCKEKKYFVVKNGNAIVADSLKELEQLLKEV